VSESDSPAASAAAARKNPYDSRSVRWYALSLLTVVYTFNFIDRQLLAILQEAIKAELSLSDSQLGLLTGFAFAIFYVTAGIPIARWADRSNRRNIVSLSLFIWSFMTALSGFVQNYTCSCCLRASAWASVRPAAARPRTRLSRISSQPNQRARPSASTPWA
jgi:sugar phosphate permease